MKLEFKIEIFSEYTTFNWDPDNQGVYVVHTVNNTSCQLLLILIIVENKDKEILGA